MFAKATELIKYGPKMRYIGDLEKKSPIIDLICPYCISNEASTIGSMCTNCLRNQARCALCQLPANGLFIWCQVCSHGGHQAHISDWFKNNNLCPVGCGHQCIPQTIVMD